MARSPKEAVAWAKSRVGSSGWRRLCLGFVRQAYGYPTSGIATAYDGWKLTRSSGRHSGTNPPPGAICWWRGPTSAGHVAISAGNGYVYSNDFKRPGKIDKVRLNDITRGWDCTYLGWTDHYPRQDKLDLDGAKPLGTTGPNQGKNTYKVGARVEVNVDVLKARLAPGVSPSTDSGRTVKRGYPIRITEVAEEDGYQWGKADRYWYALVKRNGNKRDDFYVRAAR